MSFTPFITEYLLNREITPREYGKTKRNVLVLNACHNNEQIKKKEN